MNKNNRAGGIKFRELDYNKSSTTTEQSKKSQLRSKEDVLKLFAGSSDSKKVNKPESTEENNGSDDYCDKLVVKEVQEVKNQVANEKVMPELNIVREKLNIQSSTVDSTVPKSSKKLLLF